MKILIGAGIVVFSMFIGLLLWAVVSSVKTEQDYRVSHTALCNYMVRASDSTEQLILHPPVGTTTAAKMARVKLYQYELVFLHGC